MRLPASASRGSTPSPQASDPPRHHNGLDRLDSAVRVYTEANCVSCCGE